MNPRLQRLRERVRQTVANRPGVYRMLGPDGGVLYVGKSVRVRARLLSYFRAAEGEKPRELLAATERIEWDPVPNEFAAVLREMRLIRRWRPPYNVEHNRARGFSFIRVTREAAPRFVVVGKVRADGCRYYGPLRGRSGVKEAVRELSDVLQLRDCGADTPIRFADQAELFRLELAPGCMRGDLARCLAPCARRCGESRYGERVALGLAFLEGRSDAPMAALERRMWQAAERLQFEYAVLLRERLERLRRLRDQLLILRRETRELSVAYRVPGHEGDDRVYLLRRGAVAADLPAPLGPADEARLRKRMAALGRAPVPPLHALDPERLMEVLLVIRWFRGRPEERERTEPLRALSAPGARGRRGAAAS